MQQLQQDICISGMICVNTCNFAFNDEPECTAYLNRFPKEKV